MGQCREAFRSLACSEPDRSGGAYGRQTYVEPVDDLVSATLPVAFALATIFAGSPDTTL